MDFHLRLAVGGGREDLAFAGWDGGIALDLRCRHAAQRLNREREWGNVQQQDIFHIPAQHACLDGGADRHHFVGIDAFVGFLAEEIAHGVLHGRHARHAAHHHNFVYFRGLQACIC